MAHRLVAGLLTVILLGGCEAVGTDYSYGNGYQVAQGYGSAGYGGPTQYGPSAYNQPYTYNQPYQYNVPTYPRQQYHPGWGYRDVPPPGYGSPLGAGIGSSGFYNSPSWGVDRQSRRQYNRVVAECRDKVEDKFDDNDSKKKQRKYYQKCLDKRGF